MENKKEKPTPLTPEEAIKMINGEPLDEGTTKAKGAGVKVDKEAEMMEEVLVIKEEVDMIMNLLLMELKQLLSMPI